MFIPSSTKTPNIFHMLIIYLIFALIIYFNELIFIETGKFVNEIFIA